MSDAQTEARAIAERLDDLPPNESIGAYGGSGQWIEIGTVARIRSLTTALAAKDAELAASVRKSAILEKSAGFATDDVARLDDENKALRAQLAEAHKALEWAIAEIEERTRYDNEDQFDNALRIAKDSLSSESTSGQPIERAPVDDDELQQWANLRADDAGRLARELVGHRTARRVREGGKV